MSMLKQPLLKRLAERVAESQSYFRWIDLYAAQYVSDCHGEHKSDPIAAITVILSFAGTRGETSLSLDHLNMYQHAGVKLPDWTEQEWLVYLENSPAVDVVGQSTRLEGQGELLFDHYEDYPLVLEGGQLYLSRYWRLERKVNAWLEQRLNASIELEESEWQQLGEQLQALFRLEDLKEKIDWQASAASQALSQKVCLITGGPGTGKTTTASNILSLLIKQHSLMYSSLPKVSLLAPTGKAAIRLQHSIKERFQDKEVRDLLPDSGETIHRFLLNVNKSRASRRDDFLLAGRKRKEADVDIVLVDEASMIDLALMAELVSVLPNHTRIVMLGDHYQLPAVEPGQVFSQWIRKFEDSPYNAEQIQRMSQLQGVDACLFEPAGANTNPVCQLKKTYRFGGELKRIAELIKLGSADALASELKLDHSTSSKVEASVRWCDITSPDIYVLHGQAYDGYFKTISVETSVHKLAQAFNQYQVLCTTHEGPLGAKKLNQMIERYHGLTSEAYHGKAIMVTENHTALGIFNGDIGFFVRKNSGHFVIAFPDTSESSDDDSLIEVAPASLRAWQPAYAITVHKSQGSEYKHVSLVLADYAKELLSRAMLYTGLTRAKSKADLWVSNEAIRSALQ